MPPGGESHNARAIRLTSSSKTSCSSVLIRTFKALFRNWCKLLGGHSKAATDGRLKTGHQE